MPANVRLLFAIAALAATPAAAQPSPEAAGSAVGREVVMGLLFYNACTASYPEMGTRYARGYRAWRGRNSMMITTLENEVGVKGAIAEAVRQARETAARDKEGAGAKSQCESFMAKTFVETPGAPPPKPADDGAPKKPAATPVPVPVPVPVPAPSSAPAATPTQPSVPAPIPTPTPAPPS